MLFGALGLLLVGILALCGVWLASFKESRAIVWTVWRKPSTECGTAFKPAGNFGGATIG